MDEIFEDNTVDKPKEVIVNEPEEVIVAKPIKEKKVKKKRVVTEATKKRLRAQLKKGRETALANRKRKLAEKKKIEAAT